MRTDPFQEFDRVAQRLLGDAARPSVVPMDAYRDGETFVVRSDLPGLRADSLDLAAERDVLTVRAERDSRTAGHETVMAQRPTGPFSRQLFLGETLETDRVFADYTNGALTLRVPVAGHAKPRRIRVTEGSGRSRRTRA